MASGNNEIVIAEGEKLKHAGHFIGTILNDASYPVQWIPQRPQHSVIVQYFLRIASDFPEASGKIISDSLIINNVANKPTNDYLLWLHDSISRYETILKFDGVHVVQTSLFDCLSSYEQKLRFLHYALIQNKGCETKACVRTEWMGELLEVICLGLLQPGFKPKITGK